MTETATTFAALLTTGPSPGEDAVIEVGAVRVAAAQEPELLTLLADADRLPGALAERTGLGADDLKGKPKPKAALRKLADFCGNGRVVVCDARTFTAFFEAEKLKAPDVLDLASLARLAVPEASDYSLAGIASELGLSDEHALRAEKRAQLTRRAWESLLDRLSDMPPAVLDLLCRLTETAGHPLAAVLSESAGKGDFELSSDPRSAVAELFDDHRDLFRQVQRHEGEKPGEEPLPTDAICDMFQPGAAIGRSLPGYEQRREQVEMVYAVCEAFNEPHHLMVEAGTGTGKSMGYLLPAIAWTCTNHDKVVISTNTRNLQEQLYHKDLPFLTRLMPDRFEPALLKGRRNYLCVRRFLHMVRHFERELGDPDEFLALASLVSWAVRTESGDVAECNGFLMSRGALGVLQSVVSGSEECAGRACRARGKCLVRRARALAQLADVIVVNHALLFAEIGTPVLPPYRCLIVDEAHNLEDVATDAFAVRVSRPDVYRVTNRLFRTRQDGSGSGLLATAMHELENGLREGARRDRLSTLTGNAMQTMDDVIEAVKQFFEVLAPPFEELPPYVDRVMLAECEPQLGRDSEAWDAAERMRSECHALGEKVEELAEEMDGLTEELESAEEMAQDLRSSLERLREVNEEVAFVLAQEDDNFVYWLERTTRGRASFYSIHAAPIQIGDYIRQYFLNEKRCVVFTSATLQVDGEFQYMVERLGADGLGRGEMQCLALGSPFDYDRQALVGVTNFLPDPGGRRNREFDNQLGAFLVDLLSETRGRALVLFTSYSLLESVYRSVKEPLERRGIPVLAQGHTGSREAITSSFRSFPSSVLLGTRSFWEGVDIAGETLSCLVLTKLPFHVFTDPLVRGRTEYLRMLGRDPFMHYTLPEAVISFRQGFGRLIRRRDDRGVVIVTDRRMVTKGYGRVFLQGLPTDHQVFKASDEALNAVADFFSTTQTDTVPTGE
ncbi:MAG: helicase C-terminal domain-containing protein [Candidatus Brocadiia bacterium]